MPQAKPFLEKVHIKNYRSLRDVTLSLKPITVLVGPNASGKSNIIRALNGLSAMMIRESLPQVQAFRDALWAGGANDIAFQLQARVGKFLAIYDLVLKGDTDETSVDEALLVNDVQVISIQSGQGVVQDEDGTTRTKYKSKKLALKSAGDYGNKPVTKALTQYIKAWVISDLRPERIRDDFEEFTLVTAGLTPGQSSTLRDSSRHRNRHVISAQLWYWYENDRARFDSVSSSLENSTNFRIDQCPIDGNDQLCLLKGYETPLTLVGASDGTLSLVAYYVILNQPELPPLLALEEPERNLHPGVLTDIANVLEQLSKRTQVIITTHSSQLLDAFNSENLSESLGVLLLRNRPGSGTEVINIEDIRENRASLDGWITDFGIGSAIFESELLQDLME